MQQKNARQYMIVVTAANCTLLHYRLFVYSTVRSFQCIMLCSTNEPYTNNIFDFRNFRGVEPATPRTENFIKYPYKNKLYTNLLNCVFTPFMFSIYVLFVFSAL